MNCLKHMQKNTLFRVTLPNAEEIPSTITGQLLLSIALSKKSQQAVVLSQLKSLSLISLEQLCNDDCNIQLTKKDLKVYKYKELLLYRTRNTSDRLWDIPIKTQLQSSNYVQPKLKGNLYKVNTLTLHRTISAFYYFISNLVDYNVKVASKAINNKEIHALSHFMIVLDPIAEQNYLDIIIN